MSVSMLSLATLAGQLIFFAATPFITRLYEPDVYGNYQTIYALVTIIGAVASLRLERAIPIAGDEVGARAVIVAAYAVALASMGVLALLTLIVPAGLANLLGNPEVATALWVVPIGAALTSGYLIATQWAIRVQRHGPIALRNAAQPSLTAIIQVALGAMGPTLAALNVGLLAGRLVGALSAGKELIRPAGRPSWRLVASQIGRYRSFMALSAPSALLNTAAIHLPILIIGATYGALNAGLFGLSAMLTAAPVTLLAGALSQVTMSSITQRVRVRDPGVFQLVRRSVLLAGGASVSIALAIALSSPLIAAVLGPEWSGTVPFLIALSVVIVVRLPAAVVSPALSAMEKHKSALSMDVVRVVVVIATFSYAHAASWTVEEALYLFAAGVFSTYLASVVIALVCAYRHDDQIRTRSGAA